MTEPIESNPFNDCESVNELLGMLAGAASMCWESVDRAGVFDSDQASVFVDAAKAKLADLILMPGNIDRLVAENCPRLNGRWVDDQSLAEYQQRSGWRMVDYEPKQP